MSALCERALEVEDMILGLGAADDLVSHVEACADCTDAKAMFLAERELFAARPAVEPPPLRVPSAPVIPLRAYAVRVVPALAGLAAAVAALAVGNPFGTAHHARGDCDTNVPAAITPATDEPLTCDARGFSAVTPSSRMVGTTPPIPLAMTLASNVQHEHAPVCAASDRTTCDLPESMSVTSSLATP